MEKKFKCQDCGKEITIKGEKIPDCCGKQMKKVPLAVCTQPAHAEHARPMDSDEPCDDGRAG